MIKNYIEYIKENSAKKFYFQTSVEKEIELLEIDRNKFIPMDIYDKLIDKEYPMKGHYGEMDTTEIDETYEEIIKKLMKNKYVKFKTRKGYQKQGYIKSMRFDSEGYCYIRIKNDRFWKFYGLDGYEVVKTYDKEPVVVTREIDPLGEEDWDD